MTPRAANSDLHFPTLLGAGASGKKLRMVGVRSEGEAGRSPGALADAVRPEGLQSRGGLADRTANESAAALDRREVIAKDFLNPGDSFAESVKIRFGRARQNLHERAAADFVRRFCREARQPGKRSPFRVTMRALDARVQHEENAPIAREVYPRHHGRRFRAWPSACVDGQAAALEQSDADARTRAAIEQAGVRPRVERQLRQPSKCRRDRQRQLGPGPKSGVGGNGARNNELPSQIEAKAFGDPARDIRAPLALRAENFKASRFVKLNASLERVDGEADRSKPAAKISREIEKTQVQSRRRRDLNALQTRLFVPDFFAAHGAIEFFATLRDFGCFAKRGAPDPAKSGPPTRRAAASIKLQCCGDPFKMPQSRDAAPLEDGWTMIELILTVCALNAPGQCNELRLQFAAEESLMQCMMQAPPYIAQWSDQHPATRVTRWRCAFPGEGGEKI
jgi:hypothetical protein